MIIVSHTAGFMDGVVLYGNSDRRATFIAAANVKITQSTRQLSVWILQQFFHVAHVKRPIDYSTPGIGTISGSKGKIQGKNTKFF